MVVRVKNLVALLNHLDDLARIRLAKLLLEQCREEQTDMELVIEALNRLTFIERLQTQAVVKAAEPGEPAP